MRCMIALLQVSVIPDCARLLPAPEERLDHPVAREEPREEEHNERRQLVDVTVPIWL